MKVHQFARGLWEHEPFLTLGCKRLRPLAPNLPNTAVPAATSSAAFDLKSFIRPDCGPRIHACSDDKRATTQVETQAGGTRWNPTQEQIGMLETLYRGGMRTPNAQQIEQITTQLEKYGKIEGKNVFYWFQNHKARERQKQKRSSLGLSHCPRTPGAAIAATTTTTVTPFYARGLEREVDSPHKRKCRAWMFQCLEEEERSTCQEQRDKTLELFPLLPEGR